MSKHVLNCIECIANVGSSRLVLANFCQSTNKADAFLSHPSARNKLGFNKAKLVPDPKTFRQLPLIYIYFFEPRFLLAVVGGKYYPGIAAA